MTKKISRNLLSNPIGGFLTFEAEKAWIMTINVKKIEKKIETWKKQSITYRNYKVTYCQSLKKVPWLSRLEKSQKRQKIFKSLNKCKFCQKNTKICDIKKLKLLHGQRKFSVFFINPLRRFSGPWVWSNLNNEKWMSKNWNK